VAVSRGAPPASYGYAEGVSQTEAIGRTSDGGGASLRDVLRAFGVVFGPSLLLEVAAFAALVSTLRAFRRRRARHVGAAAGAAATAGHVVAVCPWMARWGVEPHEVARPCGEDRASAEQMWPWLAQMGQDRGGFYSYEWLENLAGCRVRNADAVHPEWQHREVGEEIKLHWAYGMPVSRFEPDSAIALKGWGSFELEPLPAGERAS
jgi:hypothetical protein